MNAYAEAGDVNGARRVIQRMNTAEVPEIELTEKILIVRQSPAERALYLQLKHAPLADLQQDDDGAAVGGGSPRWAPSSSACASCTASASTV